MPKYRKPANQTPPGVLKTLKEKQGAIFRDLEQLSKRHGAEVFRLAGQRFFKRKREEEALREQIAQREAELERLKQRTTR